MPGKLNAQGRPSTPPEPQQPRRPAAKKAAKKKTTRKASTAKAGLDFIRNLHFVDVRISLSHVNDERRILHKPRGQRGDMERITDEEWDDP